MAMGDLHADWVFKENEWLLSMLNMYPQEMRAWALLLALPFCYDTKVLPSVSYMQSGHCDVPWSPSPKPSNGKYEVSHLPI